MKEAKDLSDLVQNRITYLQVSTGLPAAQPAGVHCLWPSPTHADITTRRRLTPPPQPPPPVCLTRAVAHMCVSPGHLPGLLDSLTPSVAGTHLPPGAGEGFAGRLSQQSSLTSRNLVGCQHFSDTHICSEIRIRWSRGGVPPLGRGLRASPHPPRVGPPRHRTASRINETIRLMKRNQSVWVGGDGTANSCCHHR